MPNHKSHHKDAQKAHSQAHRAQKRANEKRARQKENRAKAVAHETAANKRRRRTRNLTFVVVVIVVLALPLSLLGGNALIDASTATTTLPQSPCPTVKLPKAEERAVPQPPADVVDPQGQYTATMETSCGTMTFQLLAAEATVDVNNFVALARDGFYDDTIFHRVIRDFVIQGGDPTAPGSSSPGTGGPGYRYTGSVPATPGYQLGDLAMANSGDPSSNGSQFFIVTGPQGQNLPPNYSLFGRITEGLDVAQKISTVPVETSPADVPVIPVVVNKVTISSVETG